MVLKHQWKNMIKLMSLKSHRAKSRPSPWSPCTVQPCQNNLVYAPHNAASVMTTTAFGAKPTTPIKLCQRQLTNISAMEFQIVSKQTILSTTINIRVISTEKKTFI
jgi:hypothetical protein